MHGYLSRSSMNSQTFDNDRLLADFNFTFNYKANKVYVWSPSGWSTDFTKADPIGRHEHFDTCLFKFTHVSGGIEKNCELPLQNIGVKHIIPKSNLEIGSITKVRVGSASAPKCDNNCVQFVPHDCDNCTVKHSELLKYTCPTTDGVCGAPVQALINNTWYFVGWHQLSNAESNIADKINYNWIDNFLTLNAQKHSRYIGRVPPLLSDIPDYIEHYLPSTIS